MVPRIVETILTMTLYDVEVEWLCTETIRVDAIAREDARQKVKRGEGVVVQKLEKKKRVRNTSSWKVMRFIKLGS